MKTCTKLLPNEKEPTWPDSSTPSTSPSPSRKRSTTSPISVGPSIGIPAFPKPDASREERFLFQRIGRLAVRGLRERLAGEGSEETSKEGVVAAGQESDGRSRKRARGARKVRADHQKQGVAS